MMYSCVEVAADDDLWGTANCGDAGANPCVDANTLHASSATAYCDIIAMVMIVIPLVTIGYPLLLMLLRKQKHSIDAKNGCQEERSSKTKFHVATPTLFCVTLFTAH